MDVDLPIWERSIPFLVLYFAPVGIGAYRRWKDRDASWPVWALFLIVFFTGWSVIGWLWALRMAFRDKGLPDWMTTASSPGGGGYSPGAEVAKNDLGIHLSCGSCGGNRTQTCSMCGGRGQWYEGPYVQTCQSCYGSGTTACTSCGGTGQIR